MSQEKAQLIAPLGIVTFSGVTATGIITGIGFSGNITGSASSIVQGTSISAGVVTASSFAGNLTGNIQRLADSAPNISVGVVTATSFSGNLTGSVTDLTSAPAITVGVVTATTLKGPVTGNITGDVSGYAGGLGVNYNGGWTGAGTSQLNVGVMTATTLYGDGSNLDGVSSGPVTQQAVTINSASTNIDLSNGNVIYATQSADTTISFSNEVNGKVFFIRIKDTNDTARSITWPTSITWSGGSAPTLISDSIAGDAQVFSLTTRDEGTTWYGEEIFNLDMVGSYTGFGWGYASTGALGLNDQSSLSSPKQIGGYGEWYAVSQGSPDWPRMMWVKNTGTLWGAGKNNFRSTLGQNSLANPPEASSPIQIGNEDGWSGNIQFGYEGAMAVKTNGTLWMWGNGENGMMGLNDTVSRSSPTQVGTETTWSTAHNTIMTTNKQSAAIKTDGTLWSWGYNSGGYLGQGNKTQYSSPTQIGTGTDWAEVGGGYAKLALKTNGTLWAWGYNQDTTGIIGQNNQTNYSSPRQVGTETTWATFASTMCPNFKGGIKTDGTLWMWGRNNYGQLGLNEGPGGSSGARSSPHQVGTDTNWWQIRGAGSSMAGVKTDGTLWAWGYNAHGQLGQDDTTWRSSPTQIGTQTYWKTTKYGFGGGASFHFLLTST